MLSAVTTVGSAPNTVEVRAPRLHDLYCKSCHTASLYMKEQRKINTPVALREHVARYREKQVPVTEVEIFGIADYLWDSYYSEAAEQ